KIARLEKRRHFWTKEDAAWSALIDVQDSGFARINRALCRRRLHRWHDAFADLEKAKTLAADDPDVQRGAKLLERIDKWLPAIRETETAERLDPKATGASAEASYALTKLGRVPEALEQIKRATELEPDFSTAWQYRGELEMAKGETLSAIDSFTHSLETNQTIA